jgi:hypothetical protein
MVLRPDVKVSVVKLSSLFLRKLEVLPSEGKEKRETVPVY